jgi:hypothetical protein
MEGARANDCGWHSRGSSLTFGVAQPPQTKKEAGIESASQNQPGQTSRAAFAPRTKKAAPRGAALPCVILARTQNFRVSFK